MMGDMDAVADDRAFGHVRLRGGRYDQPGLPVTTAVELARYQRLVSAVAYHLYMRAHPKRKRAPRGFSESLDLRLVDVQPGSVIPVLSRTPTSQPTLLGDDWHEQARVLINEALANINRDQRLPAGFPVEALKEFASFGRSLQDDEVIEFSGNGADVAPFTPQTRRRIQSLANLEEIEVELLVQGQVIGLHSDPQRLDVLLAAPSNRKLVGEYTDPGMWDTLREFLGFADRAPLAALSVVARQGLDGEIRAIVDVLGIEAALPTEWADRIAELASLRKGWLDPDSDSPSRETLDVTEEFLLACVDEGLPRPSIYPSADGGVQLEWRTDSVSVELDILNSGTAHAYAFDIAGNDDHELVQTEIDSDALLNFATEHLNG